MRLTKNEFLNHPNKSITLLGMSGLGKTTLSEILNKDGWYHYSADYRIGTKYLDQPILDNLKNKIGTIPFVKRLLDSNTVRIENNLTIDNLEPLSTFLGQLGNPEQGGLSLPEFKKRQDLYGQAEVASMMDVPHFMAKAKKRGHAHFVNDSSGSLCELDNEDVLKTLSDHTVLVYIEATSEDEQELIKRAQAYPKPLYFSPSFFDTALQSYMEDRNLDYVALIEPNDFSSWVFPELFRSRLPKYQYIADTYGYTISADDARHVKTADDLINLIGQSIDAKSSGQKPSEANNAAH